jgi:hypothetical protein
MTAPATAEPLSFSCPRCQQASTEAYYGPCSTCRTDLVRTLGREARAVEASDYLPKVNVTPNAVAQKD